MTDDPASPLPPPGFEASAERAAQGGSRGGNAISA